ncbi:MAG: selenocysteine-specific translation elongation factor, partial [Eggerthellaceae bacterium]|nr:selenocysteine-specific translation elongation factor [Eggerthellaceae bacterium]
MNSNEKTTTHHDFVMGTAGHIDHGKSALVKALTGTDPDRLKEEKQRGITIELGFASLNLDDGTTLGIVDVPGHEHFVRQMIAGSTGIDFALICIAADDGVMPQTLEHIDVLELLGVDKAIIALTKTDIADADWIEYVEDDIRERLKGTSFSDSPIIEASSRTGEGLDDLRAALEKIVSTLTPHETSSAFRMPVDRVFTIKGAGTVVTGTVWSGDAHVGQEVEILPQHRLSRIREIEVHGKELDSVSAGHRSALNLSGLSTADIRPGNFVATPGLFDNVDYFDVMFTYTGGEGITRPFKSGSPIHFAHGTAEVNARLLLIGDKDQLTPGQNAFAQVRTDHKLPVAAGDRFIVRSFSPVHVIGGGTILRTHGKRTTNLSDDETALLSALSKGEEETVADCALKLMKDPMDAVGFARTFELEPGFATGYLDGMASKNAVVAFGKEGKKYYIPKPLYQKITSAVTKSLLDFHGKNPDEPGIAPKTLKQQQFRHTDEKAFEALLDHMASDGTVVFEEGLISHPQAGITAKRLEEEASHKLLEVIENAGVEPPLVN